MERSTKCKQVKHEEFKVRLCKKCNLDIHWGSNSMYCGFCIKSFNTGVPSHIFRQMYTYFKFRT